MLGFNLIMVSGIKKVFLPIILLIILSSSLVLAVNNSSLTDQGSSFVVLNKSGSGDVVVVLSDLEKVPGSLKKSLVDSLDSRKEARSSFKQRLELLKLQKNLSKRPSLDSVNKSLFLSESFYSLDVLYSLTPFLGNNSFLIEKDLSFFNDSLNSFSKKDFLSHKSFFKSFFSSKHVLPKDLNLFFAKNNLLLDDLIGLVDSSADSDPTAKDFALSEIVRLRNLQSSFSVYCSSEQSSIHDHFHKRFFSWFFS